MELPTIILTAMPNGTRTQSALAAGALDVFCKPPDTAQLRAALHLAL